MSIILPSAGQVQNGLKWAEDTSSEEDDVFMRRFCGQAVGRQAGRQAAFWGSFPMTSWPFYDPDLTCVVATKQIKEERRDTHIHPRGLTHTHACSHTQTGRH